MNILGYDFLAGYLGCYHYVLEVIFKVRVQNGNTFGSMPKFLVFEGGGGGAGMPDMPECFIFFLFFFWGGGGGR